ncbi:putative hemoglobin and hemoglobin-haptoglobin-binding protein 3 precursor, partial [Haemophilus influenzae]
MGFVKLKL